MYTLILRVWKAHQLFQAWRGIRTWKKSCLRHCYHLWNINYDKTYPIVLESGSSKVHVRAHQPGRCHRRGSPAASYLRVGVWCLLGWIQNLADQNLLPRQISGRAKYPKGRSDERAPTQFSDLINIPLCMITGRNIPRQISGKNQCSRCFIGFGVWRYHQSRNLACKIWEATVSL